MKKFNLFSKVALAAVLVAGVLSLAGCKPQVEYRDNYYIVTPMESSNTLIGDWTSTFGEIFTITASNFKNGGSWGDCYAGNNLYVCSIDETSGYIYFKYTRAMNPDYSYSETAPDVGKWYAVYYKQLTAASVNLTAAFKAGGKTSTETLTDAVSEFTVANGYFASGSDCTKTSK